MLTHYRTFLKNIIPPLSLFFSNNFCLLWVWKAGGHWGIKSLFTINGGNWFNSLNSNMLKTALMGIIFFHSKGMLLNTYIYGLSRIFIVTSASSPFQLILLNLKLSELSEHVKCLGGSINQFIFRWECLYKQFEDQSLNCHFLCGKRHLQTHLLFILNKIKKKKNLCLLVNDLSINLIF